MKERGYGWGLSSALASSLSLAFPLVSVMVGSMAGAGAVLQTVCMCLFLLFPPIGFVLAFIGRGKSEYGTKTRRLCNVGAGIGLVISAVFVCAFTNVLLQDAFSISLQAASVTGVVDATLFALYFWWAYVRGKILWFLG